MQTRKHANTQTRKHANTQILPWDFHCHPQLFYIYILYFLTFENIYIITKECCACYIYFYFIFLYHSQLIFIILLYFHDLNIIYNIIINEICEWYMILFYFHVSPTTSFYYLLENFMTVKYIINI
jgi:hypothetical protein